MNRGQDEFAVIAAVNNDAVLAENLAASSVFGNGVGLTAMRGYGSAGQAYNTGLEMTTAEVVIFAHQDVYLPHDWLNQLRKGIRSIEEVDDRWGIIGVYGVKTDGGHVGHCWSTGLGCVLGNPFLSPQPVGAIDELVIVLRRSTGLRFDDGLPGFHLYGTDIVQTALSSGFGAYVVHAPVIHNSFPVRNLFVFGPYSRAYRYMRKKWVPHGPIFTTVLPVTRWGIPLLRDKLRRALLGLMGRARVESRAVRERGSVIAERLGFETRTLP